MVILQSPTYWQATKVMWAFYWRCLLWMLLPAFLLGVAFGIISAATGTSRALCLGIGVMLSMGFVVNFYRIMLNKARFRGFTFTLNPEHEGKVTWWQATKVSWSLIWRGVLYCMVPVEIISILAGYVLGGVESIYGIHPSAATHAGSVLLGLVIGFGGAIVFYHYLLKKSEFKTFIIKAQ